VKHNRAAGFAFIALVYVAALVVGVVTYLVVASPSWPVRLLLADVAATVFVFVVSLVVGNASVYDPYWSVAPPVICAALMPHRWDWGTVLLLAVVWLWGVRLTANWAVTFRNLGTQDWRYDDLKRQFPRAFPLVSLCGIMLFPTLVVYGCVIPAVFYLQHPRLTWLTLVGLAVCLLGTGLELVADVQMQRFRRANPAGGLIRQGLWTHARHPNYLGEMLMWWGVFVVAMSAVPNYWWTGVGALVNTAMFLFVSIPMADRRNRRRRDGFDEYCRQTNSLLPIPLVRR